MSHGMALVAALIVIATAGCMSGVRSPLEHEITKRVTPEKPEFDIDGWTDRTGAHHKLHGRARIAGDSIQLYQRNYVTNANPTVTTKLVATVPRSDVTEVSVQRFDPVKTGLFIATPALLYGLLILIIVESGYEP
ncbi:MAG TPA: hypothetical protein VFX78_00120 [Candidatus Eisenbacteria bacterium]|nr:hypothetical protein [Candidatus Eisenbacteria bacterium]